MPDSRTPVRRTPKAAAALLALGAPLAAAGPALADPGAHGHANANAPGQQKKVQAEAGAEAQAPAVQAHAVAHTNTHARQGGVKTHTVEHAVTPASGAGNVKTHAVAHAVTTSRPVKIRGNVAVHSKGRHKLRLRLSHSAREAALAKVHVMARTRAVERLDWCRTTAVGARTHVKGRLPAPAAAVLTGKRVAVAGGAASAASLARWVRAYERGQLTAAELLVLVGGSAKAQARVVAPATVQAFLELIASRRDHGLHLGWLIGHRGKQLSSGAAVQVAHGHNAAGQNANGQGAAGQNANGQGVAGQNANGQGVAGEFAAGQNAAGQGVAGEFAGDTSGGAGAVANGNAATGNTAVRREAGGTTAASSGQLPFTGMPVPLLVLLGAGSLAAGVALRRRTAPR